MHRDLDRGEEDIKSLIKALKEKPKFARLGIYTLNCFGNLARNRQNLDRIVKENAFPEILKIMKIHKDNSRLTVEGTVPLIRSCKVPEYAKKLGNEGGIEYCIEQLRTSQDNFSNAHVANLLKALIDGDPSNAEKFKQLGGEKILAEVLEKGNKSKKSKMPASVLSVLETLSRDHKFCQSVDMSTIEKVVESLKLFSSDKSVTIPAIKILSNVAKVRGPEVIEKLRNMNAVTLISNAMHCNAADKELQSVGENALRILSDQSDLDKAISSMGDKNLETIKKAEFVSLVGNLSQVVELPSNLEKNVLERLAKIIKSLVNIEKISKDKRKLLASTIQSAGKVAIKCDGGPAYFCKNILNNLVKILKNPSLTEEILAAVNNSLDSIIKDKETEKKVIKHPKLLPLLFEKDKAMKSSDAVRSSTIEVVKHLGSSKQGLQTVSKHEMVPLLCSFVDENIKKSDTVIRCFESFLDFVPNIDVLSEKDISSVVKSALSVLKHEPDNLPVCQKALEVLQAYADHSQFVRNKLMYEYSSDLSKFRKETSYDILKEAVDALKNSLKGKGVEKQQSIEDLLETIHRESKGIKGDKEDEETCNRAFIASDSLVLEVSNKGEKAVSELKKLKAVEKLSESILGFEKALPSSVCDSLLANILKVLAVLNEEKVYCATLSENGFYALLAKIHVKPATSDEVKLEIKNHVDLLKSYQWDEVMSIRSIDLSSKDELYEKLNSCIFLTEALKSLPKEIRMMNLNEEIDIVANLVQKNADDPKLTSLSLKLLDLLTSYDGDNKEYFSANYIGSLCHVVKSNADNDMFVSSILTMLASYENEENVVEHISELKTWYVNRKLETDIEAQKLFFLNKALEILNESDKKFELNHNLKRLSECYDGNNSLVDLNENPTEVDKEIVKLATYILTGSYDEETKKAALELIKNMIKNSKIEKFFYDDGFLSSIERIIQTEGNKKTLLLYVSTLIPFLSSENIIIRNFAQNAINKMMMGTKKMSDFERVELLDELIQNMDEEMASSFSTSECFDSLLVLFEKQKTPEGKAKVLDIINKMVQSSEYIALEIAQQKGLHLIMSELKKENFFSIKYVQSLTALTVSLAEHRGCVENMYKENVESSMKELMFMYTNHIDIFHNAQRTIDLMSLGRRDLPEHEMKKWKMRSRIKQLMTEICRGLGVKISSVLTRSEREVSTGDTIKDISNECGRILNEFGKSFDEMIEADSTNNLLVVLAEAFLLRANLMTYTFLVEKDVSARSVLNAPTKIEDALVSICGFTAMWDFQNKDFKPTNRAVRGGITHQSVQILIDSSVDAQPAQETDLVTKEAVGSEYNLEDLITWVKLDVEEENTLRCFDLALNWVTVNWNLVTITLSMKTQVDKNGVYRPSLLERDGRFLSIRCGLDWDWDKSVHNETNYVYNDAFPAKDYLVVEKIDSKTKKTGIVIKVEISGEKLRQKRREIKETLDFRHSNVLTPSEKDYLEFFLEIADKGINCRKFTKSILKTKTSSTFLRFDQDQENTNLYLSWGNKDDSPEKREKFEMKEVEAIDEGKKSKVLKKTKEASEDMCFTVKATGDREIDLQVENKADRDMWTKGLRLILCTVANCKFSNMVW